MPKPKPEQHTWALFWAPEGKRIGVVTAPTREAAIRKAPKPYRKYLGEVYAEELLVPTP